MKISVQNWFCWKMKNIFQSSCSEWPLWSRPRLIAWIPCNRTMTIRHVCCTHWLPTHIYGASCSHGLALTCVNFCRMKLLIASNEFWNFKQAPLFRTILLFAVLQVYRKSILPFQQSSMGLSTKMDGKNFYKTSKKKMKWFIFGASKCKEVIINWKIMIMMMMIGMKICTPFFG